jgi:hypothetical protein
MSTKMAALDRDLPLAGGAAGGPAARLVSISVDPEHDQPAVLAAYAERYRASDRWLFLTGDRDEIYRLAGEGMHLGFDPNPPLVPLREGDNIYHSTRFVLVDGLGRVRGYYDSESSEELELLRGDLARLIEVELPRFRGHPSKPENGRERSRRWRGSDGVSARSSSARR